MLRDVRAVFIANPQATSTTVGGRDVLAHALASEMKLDVVETTHRGHAAEAAAAAVDDGVDLIIAHGGDGTVNEIVNGMLSELPAGDERLPTLGVVPGGLANVFARALGLPNDPVEATHRLLRSIDSGRGRWISLGKANERWFTFNAGIGWDAEVIAAVERIRSTGRTVSATLYMRTAFACYVECLCRRPFITLRMPNESPAHNLHSVFVSNTDPFTYLGSRALRMNPSTTFDTGLGTFALRTMNPYIVWRYVAQMLRGRAKPHKRNSIWRANLGALRVTCREPLRLQVDGDNLGERSTVEFLSVPGALRVAV